MARACLHAALQRHPGKLDVSTDCSRADVANDQFEQGCYLGKLADAQRPGGPAPGGCCMQGASDPHRECSAAVGMHDSCLALLSRQAHGASTLRACTPHYFVRCKLCPRHETTYLQRWRQPMRSTRPAMTMATLVAILTKMLATVRQQVQSPHHGWQVGPWQCHAHLVSDQNVRVAETSGTAAASAQPLLEQHQSQTPWPHVQALCHCHPPLCLLISCCGIFAVSCRCASIAGLDLRQQMQLLYLPWLCCGL